MNKILNFIFLIMVCNTIYAQNGKTFVLKDGHVDMDYANCNRLSSQSGYVKYGKIYVSKNYRLIDSIDIGKQEHYKILILSPLTQNIDDTLGCSLNIKRVILILKYRDHISQEIQYISDNIILNNFDSQSEPYIKGILPYKNGFGLAFCVGSKIRCDLNMYFCNWKGKFYLKKTRSSYYTTDLKKTKNQVLYYKLDRSNELDQIKTLKLVRFPNW